MLLWLGALLLVYGCASAPAYLSMESEELWTTGTAGYEDEDWDRAIERLERFVAISPGDPRVPEARMLVARSYMAREEYLTAAAEFERFLQLHPSHGLAPEASLGICRSYAELSPIPQRDQAYTREAVTVCGETSFEFRGLSVATEADSIAAVMTDRLAEAVFQRAQYYQRTVPESAIRYFEDVINLYPESRWTPRAMLEIFRVYRSFDWVPEAEEAASRLLNNFPDSEAARELRDDLAEEPRFAPDDAGL